MNCEHDSTGIVSAPNLRIGQEWGEPLRLNSLIYPSYRPQLDKAGTWGGYDWDSLRIAGLARGVLTKLNYMHVCTPAYRLLNRASCRFFFSWCVAFEAASLSTRKLFANHLHVVCFKGHWPQQPYQVYDENTQRLALRRQLCDDDQWVTQRFVAGL